MTCAHNTWGLFSNYIKFLQEIPRLAELQISCYDIANPNYVTDFFIHVGCIRAVMKGEKQWELQVDHSLFAISKLDLTVSTNTVPCTHCYYNL